MLISTGSSSGGGVAGDGAKPSGSRRAARLASSAKGGRSDEVLQGQEQRVPTSRASAAGEPQVGLPEPRQRAPARGAGPRRCGATRAELHVGVAHVELLIVQDLAEHRARRRVVGRAPRGRAAKSPRRGLLRQVQEGEQRLVALASTRRSSSPRSPGASQFASTPVLARDGRRAGPARAAEEFGVAVLVVGVAQEEPAQAADRG